MVTALLTAGVAGVVLAVGANLVRTAQEVADDLHALTGGRTWLVRLRAWSQRVVGVLLILFGIALLVDLVT